MKLTVQETELLERAVQTHCRVIDQLLDAHSATGNVLNASYRRALCAQQEECAALFKRLKHTRGALERSAAAYAETARGIEG